MGQPISFGPYRLDLTGGLLLRGDARVPLRLKTFAVLEYLATHPGRLIAREELLDAVWPGVHVTPSVLAGCIREIRRALGDDARCARFVETEHRRGYRFIAEAEPASALIEATERILVLARDTELAAAARRFAAMVAAFVERGEPERPPIREPATARGGLAGALAGRSQRARADRQAENEGVSLAHVGSAGSDRDGLVRERDQWLALVTTLEW
jgi:DNA-binding winged helix-turn-helix (wHTH) protein